MHFKDFQQAFAQHLQSFLSGNRTLYIAGVGKDLLWNTYLDSFPPGTNEVYREQREFDCQCCKSFMRQFGRVVAISDGKLTSIWNFQVDSTTYQPVLDALTALIEPASIGDRYFTKKTRIGNSVSYTDDFKVWHHLYADIPDAHIYRGHKSIPDSQNEARTAKQVLKRGLDELTPDALSTVIELIDQQSLYRGEQWKEQLVTFRSTQTAYRNLPASQQDTFCWDASDRLGPAIARIRNHSIGTLLIDISNDIDLDEAVRRYEAIVAPSSYQRPKSIYSKRMLEDARATVERLGLTASLPRRFARLDDITINNILFANRDVTKQLGGDIFDDMAASIGVKTKQFDHVETVPIATFVSDILPNLTTIEVLLENQHAANLVSLIAPGDRQAPPLMKWNNGFGWGYRGNLADSMKERVKAAGGKVDGILRFSLQWNDNGDNNNDFDAHCNEPCGNLIYYARKRNSHTGGNLDVDIVNPSGNVAVENITWPDIQRMKTGDYLFKVHNFSHRGGRSGFSAEIEFNGQVHSYTYDKELRNNETVPVATVTLNSDRQFSIKDVLPSSTATRAVWGLTTQQFHPVSVMMYSPNYWDDQSGVGNRHYFFMLNGCINDEQPNGFFNEFLRTDLRKHRRVFEALGSKMRVDPSPEQLSGLGFSSTQRNSLVCKVTGNFSRTLRVQF